MPELSRPVYADLFGPTTGDRIRLADTDLVVEIEEDRSGGPGLAGDEAVFGGGKVIRESMGQARTTRAEGAPDTVITGAVIIDHWGVVKADIGIRDGRITGIGKAGNPDTMDGVHPELVIGPETEIIVGNGKFVTMRHRRARPLHLADPRRPGPVLRDHHTGRRGYGPGRGDQGHHDHPGALASGPDVRGAGRLPRQHRTARQGQHDVARGHALPTARRGTRVQDP